jgi:hypothetical protein
MKFVFASKISIAVIAAGVCVSAIAAPAKFDRDAFFQESKAAISKCQDKYTSAAALDQVNNMLWEARYNNNQSRAALTGQRVEVPKRDDTPALHLKCVDEQKAVILPEGKQFIGSIRNAAEKQRARGLVAQWLTAMDSIGKQNNDQEVSKFETIVNGFVVDSQ